MGNGIRRGSSFRKRARHYHYCVRDRVINQPRAVPVVKAKQAARGPFPRAHKLQHADGRLLPSSNTHTISGAATGPTSTSPEVCLHVRPFVARAVYLAVYSIDRTGNALVAVLRNTLYMAQGASV